MSAKTNKKSSRFIATKRINRSLMAVFIAGVVAGISSCGGGGGSTASPAPSPAPAPTPTPTPTPSSISFTERTDNLPDGLAGKCMDGEAADIDGDGDLDLLLAIEWQPNILLTNNAGNFSLSSPFADRGHDSEDVIAADFDGDGDLDVLFVSEDDGTNELYLNQGGSFVDASDRIPLGGKSNAVAVFDANEDGHLDVIIGNDGKNLLLLNDGNAQFIDHTDNVEIGRGITQDIEIADIDNDGDLDVLTGNENLNKIFINNGDGTFTDESTARLPDISAESRDLDIGDVDGDGDLDMLVSNVTYFQSFDAANYLLINDGSGNFSLGELVNMPGQHADADLVDLDGDGDLDIITGTAYLIESVGSNSLYVNDSSGVFSNQAMSGNGNVFDVVAADFNGDGKQDLYFCNRRADQTAAGFEGGQDRLFIAD